jgi:hypothetical protein
MDAKDRERDPVAYPKPGASTSYYYAAKFSRPAQMICNRKAIGIGYFPAKAQRR